MRTMLALTLACLALPAVGLARPLSVHVGLRGHGHDNRAARVLLAEGILTPAELLCTDVVHGHRGSARVEQVSLFRRYGGPCPGVRQPPTYLYDVYVDMVSGIVDYTPGSREDLLTVLPGEHIMP